MHIAQLRTKTRAIVSALAFLAMVTPFVAAPQVSYAKGGDAPRYQGWVQARPAGGFAGTWKIGGKTFVATAGTQIDQAQGQLNVGACAKVKFQVVNGQNRALEIDSQPAADCR